MSRDKMPLSMDVHVLYTLQAYITAPAKTSTRDLQYSVCHAMLIGDLQ